MCLTIIDGVRITIKERTYCLLRVGLGSLVMTTRDMPSFDSQDRPRGSDRFPSCRPDVVLPRSECQAQQIAAAPLCIVGDLSAEDTVALQHLEEGDFASFL